MAKLKKYTILLAEEDAISLCLALRYAAPGIRSIIADDEKTGPVEPDPLIWSLSDDDCALFETVSKQIAADLNIPDEDEDEDEGDEGDDADESEGSGDDETGEAGEA